MNLILLEQDEIAKDNTVVLRGRRRDHIVHVLQAVRGDSVRVGVINGPTGTGEIVSLNDEVVLSVGLDLNHPAVPSVDLILALPRPIMLQRVFFQAAQLGVGRIFLVNANRVEKSFFNATLLREKKYNAFLLQGLEQAMDTRLPEVSIYPRFRPFVEDVVPEMKGGYSHTLLAHPESEQRLPDVLGAGAGRVLLAIGPEGGWVDFEVEKFREVGFHPFTMGQRILRVDTAVVALMSQVNYAMGKI